MKHDAQTRLIERAVHGVARKVAIEYYAFVPQQNKNGLWLRGERSVTTALEVWKMHQADKGVEVGMEVRLVSGMTIVDVRSRSVRLWAIAPADSGAGVACTENEALGVDAWWNPAMDEPFYPEPRQHLIDMLRERFVRIVQSLKKRGVELCAREIAAILNDEQELERLAWNEDWMLKAMRSWADGAARWEERRRASSGKGMP